METLNTRDKLELSRKLARISLNGICADLKADTEYGHDKITEVYSGKKERTPHRHHREANIRLCKISC